MEAATVGLRRQAGSASLGLSLNRLRSDDGLAVRFAAGDDGAFAAIYDRHARVVFGVCMGVLGEQEDARDASQEAFSNLARTLARSDAKVENLRGLIVKIAREAAIDISRRRRVAPEHPSDLSAPAAEDTAILHSELRSTLGALKRLPEAQRSALMLRELAGCSREEIARTLEIDEPAVRHLIERARVAIRADAQSASLACESVRRTLVAETDGRRRPSEVRRHLRACDGCREYRGALRHDAHVVRGLAPGAGLLWRFVSLFRGGAQPQLVALAPEGMLDHAVRVAVAAGIVLAGTTGGSLGTIGMGPQGAAALDGGSSDGFSRSVRAREGVRWPALGRSVFQSPGGRETVGPGIPGGFAVPGQGGVPQSGVDVSSPSGDQGGPAARRLDETTGSAGSGESGSSGALSETSTPGAPGTPGVPGAPGTPSPSTPTGAPDAPGTPGAPEAPSAPDMNPGGGMGGQELPDGPGAPGVPDAPRSNPNQSRVVAVSPRTPGPQNSRTATVPTSAVSPVGATGEVGRLTKRPPSAPGVAVPGAAPRLPKTG